MNDTLQSERLTEEPEVPVSEVERLMTTIGKSLRAFNMYQANNPVFQRFQAALRAEFASLWEQADELALGVTEEGFRYGDRVFAIGRGRDNLAFAFYKDGIRDLTFLRGFENEVGEFLDAVNRAMKSEHGGDDLITVLWEQDFEALQYGYVDLLTEGLAIPDEPRSDPAPIEGDLSMDLGPVEGASDDAPEATEAAGASGPQGLQTLSTEDFDETLYFLDPGEMATLQIEVDVEMERDLRRDVLNALFDRLEEPRPERQEEILDILEQLLPLFLSRGDMLNAGRILEELNGLQGNEDLVSGPLQERIERLFDRLSDVEVLEQFVQALEEGAVSPDSSEVSLFFKRLHSRALPVLIRFAEMSDSSGVRERLGSAIDGLAERYPSEVSALLSSDEPAVVKGAARVAGRVGLTQTVSGLHEALGHPDRDVRLAVVEALVAIRGTSALQALTTALDDDDRDVRIAAARALGAVRFASARAALASVIEGKQVREADLTEKMAFFEAYGAVGGTAAVERLDELLNSKGFLGRRNPSELRACAALGLGQAGTPQAKAALERARYEEDSVVRNAVLRALKEEQA